jgi:hypothetical protein
MHTRAMFIRRLIEVCAQSAVSTTSDCIKPQLMHTCCPCKTSSITLFVLQLLHVGSGMIGAVFGDWRSLLYTFFSSTTGLNFLFHPCRSPVFRYDCESSRYSYSVSSFVIILVIMSVCTFCSVSAVVPSAELCIDVDICREVLTEKLPVDHLEYDQNIWICF